MNESLMDVADTAAYLAVSEKTVRRYAVSLGAVKVGNRLRFERARIDRWLEDQTLGGRRVRSP